MDRVLLQDTLARVYPTERQTATVIFLHVGFNVVVADLLAYMFWAGTWSVQRDLANFSNRSFRLAFPSCPLDLAAGVSGNPHRQVRALIFLSLNTVPCSLYP